VKGQLKVSTPAEYFAQLDVSRKADVEALDSLIRKVAPKLTPFVHIGMLAYGPCRLQYAGGREGDWFRIGIASNKNYTSFYVGGVADRYREALPKAKIGKGCVRFKRLGDLDEAALKNLIRECAKA
jgi:hypothetical protein